MELLDLLMVVYLLVLVVNEHMVLDEHVEELPHVSVRVEGEGSQGSLAWSLATVTKHDEEITHGEEGSFLELHSGALDTKELLAEVDEIVELGDHLLDVTGGGGPSEILDQVVLLPQKAEEAGGLGAGEAEDPDDLHPGLVDLLVQEAEHVLPRAQTPRLPPETGESEECGIRECVRSGM